jgi:diaminopimelate decarboxylase
MNNVLTRRKAAIARAAIAAGLLREEAPLVGIVDFAALGATVAELKRAFPGHFTHAFAAKANGAPAVLSFLRSLGMGQPRGVCNGSGRRLPASGHRVR